MSLNDEELERYSRQIILPEIGGRGQMLLHQAHAIVIGAGGIGCPALLYLAAAGFGRISIIDHDHVSRSNLARQTLFADAQIGQPKAQAAAAALMRLNPHVAIAAHDTRLTAANAGALLAGADVILDGSDNFATRLTVSDASVQAQIPLVSAAIGRFQGQIGTFHGWRADAPCYRCFVGDAFDADDCDSCAEIGVLGAMCGLIGSFAAMEAVRVITGFGTDQVGRLHLFDGLTPDMRTIRLPKDPGCRGCGTI